MTPEERKDMLCTLAEKVCGWEIRTVGGPNMPRGIAHVSDGEGGDYPLCVWGKSPTSRKWMPDENMDDAWMLVAALSKRYRRVEVHALPDSAVCLIEGGTNDVDEHYIATGDGATAPEAICNAALASVGLQEGR